MPDDSQKPNKRSLSEISHLFLSSVRDRQTSGAERPRRMPPVRSDVTIDLTPDEFAQMYGGTDPAAEPRRRIVPVAAVIAAHMNGKQLDRVKEYARHLASRVGRVGLIELDASEFRLMCFEPAAPHGPGDAEPQPPECGEPRQMTEALEEMNWDVEQWLLLLPNPRTSEAKALLRQIEHWVLLSTCDHDGVVSSYRMLKGLAEASRPRLALALMDTADDMEVQRVFQKLSGVCRQFLNWPLESEPAVEPALGVSEHLASLFRPMCDKAQLANGPQWEVVSQFLAAAKAAGAVAEQPALTANHDEPPDTATAEEARQLLDDGTISTSLKARASGESRPAPDARSASNQNSPASSPPNPFQAAAAAPICADDSFEDVIDLPGHDASGQSILAAVLRKAAGGLIECPLRPPMCVEARLAVGRDHEIVLLAVARQGLTELRAIGQAYRWLTENRELIAMALPQFAIHASHSPKLRLLVDRADLTADILHPLLQSEHVMVQAYRKLRWGERLGVALEAA